MNINAFTSEHMDELRRLETEGHACAKYAIQEIEQLNEYVYALEYALMFGFSNTEEVRGLIAEMRERFAPDVMLPDVPVGGYEQAGHRQRSRLRGHTEGGSTNAVR